MRQKPQTRQAAAEKTIKEIRQMIHCKKTGMPSSKLINLFVNEFNSSDVVADGDWYPFKIIGRVDCGFTNTPQGATPDGLRFNFCSKDLNI